MQGHITKVTRNCPEMGKQLHISQRKGYMANGQPGLPTRWRFIAKYPKNRQEHHVAPQGFKSHSLSFLAAVPNGPS